MRGAERVRAGAACLAVLLASSPAARGADGDKAWEALQGVYAFKAGVEDGVPDESTSQDIGVWRFEVTGDVLEMRPGAVLEQSGLFRGAGLKWKFRLDPTARPRRFDVTFMSGPLKGRAALGIYKFEGGELTIVTGSATSRPASFDGGKGRFKLVLVKKSKQ